MTPLTRPHDPEKVPADPIIRNQGTEPPRALAETCNACDLQLSCLSAYLSCPWLC